jgi:RNA polymerase sigma-70 factor, ECF subfamily
MPRSDDESALIAKAQAGANSALEQLFQSHYEPLFQFIVRNCPDQLLGKIDAQDILQDTLLRAVRAIKDLRSDENFFSWVTAIARNLITDHFRHWSARKRGGDAAIVGANHSEQLEKLLGELALYLKTPSASARRHELMVVIDGAISRLPVNQSKALRLRHLEGWDIDSVAVEMERSRESVMQLISRGLKSLRWELRSFSLDI